MSGIRLASVSVAMLAGIGAQSPRALLGSGPAMAGASSLLAEQPIRFVPNVGQWRSPELYRAHAGPLSLFLQRRSLVLGLSEGPENQVPQGARPGRGATATPPPRSLALRMSFAGSGDVRLEPEGRLSGVTNYLRAAANGPSCGDVPGYSAVVYRSVWRGVDLRLRQGPSGLEYDVLLESGVDLDKVEIGVEGAKGLRVDSSGCLVISTELGEVRQPRPVTWMVGAGGARIPVACEYVLRGERGFGFVARSRDRRLALVVDPQILYSTFLGGSLNESPIAITEDTSGRIFVAGVTPSIDFPSTVGALQPAFAGGTTDGFIVCIDPSIPGKFVFATYLGGSGDDRVCGVAALPGGIVGFAGDTTSTNLPVPATAYQTANAGGRDLFAGTLNAQGNALLGLTYLGGSGTEVAWSMIPASPSALVIAGSTTSSNFPTLNPYQGTYAGGACDAVVAQVSFTGSTLVYSTYVGTPDGEGLGVVDVSPANVITLLGDTDSRAFPVTSTALAAVHGGGLGQWWGQEGIVLRLDPVRVGASQLVYSTYLGGNGEDETWWGAVAPNGDIVVTGTTTSTNFPTTTLAYATAFVGGAFFNTNYVAGDAFVVRIDPTKSGMAGLVLGTYLGGAGQDQGLGCALDSTGEVSIVGWSQNGSGVPTTPDALRRTYALNEGWVARLSGNGRQVLYASLLGGSNHDGAWLATRHVDGVPTITGGTLSADFPTLNAAQPALKGGQEGFATRMSLVPAGTSRYGQPTKTWANGWPTIHALGDAVPGNLGFGLACSRANSNKAGVLFLGAAPLASAPVLGILLQVDLAQAHVPLPVTSNTPGESTIALPWPQGAVGSVYAQYVWVDVTTPFALSASDALKLN